MKISPCALTPSGGLVTERRSINIRLPYFQLMSEFRSPFELARKLAKATPEEAHSLFKQAVESKASLSRPCVAPALNVLKEIAGNRPPNEVVAALQAIKLMRLSPADVKPIAEAMREIKKMPDQVKVYGALLSVFKKMAESSARELILHGFAREKPASNSGLDANLVAEAAEEALAATPEAVGQVVENRNKIPAFVFFRIIKSHGPAAAKHAPQIIEHGLSSGHFALLRDALRELKLGPEEIADALIEHGLEYGSHGEKTTYEKKREVRAGAASMLQKFTLDPAQLARLAAALQREEPAEHDLNISDVQLQRLARKKAPLKIGREQLSVDDVVRRRIIRLLGKHGELAQPHIQAIVEHGLTSPDETTKAEAVKALERIDFSGRKYAGFLASLFNYSGHSARFRKTAKE
ncbi:hypothetical protein AUJ65_03415 [Candidatus Micrarchaeota archaeon CG1_02_51_15]|nr:MAG: hypothetical protein AUJ65_03415 [Candidatus Micrarchaeota archaeon CG1_02_51_15]